MDLYEKVTEMAVKLRIPESDILQWVENKVAKAEKKQEEDLQKKERKEELERAERREKEEREERERAAERAMKIELKKLELQPDKQKSPESHSVLGGRPKIPPFNARDDEIDLFLERFEKQAQFLKWEKSSWPTSLLNLLTGEALTVLLSLDPEASQDYDAVKDALLLRFNCSVNSFREKFTNAKPKPEENFDTFFNRVNRYYSRWLHLAEANDFQSLSFLILKEQVFSACDIEFVTYVKDRNPKSAEDLKKIATAYVLSRPNKPFGKIKAECVAFSASQVDHTLSGADQHRGRSTCKNFSGGNSRNRPYSSGGYRGDRLQSPSKHNITCFTCGKKGHIQRECRSAKNGNRVEGQKPVTCYGCGGIGHFRSKCPSQKRDRSGGRRKSEVTSNVAVGTDEYFVPIVDELSCSTGVIDRNGSIELHNAVVNGVNCKLLRDTGCTCVGVRGSLVPDGSRTGRTVKVRTFLGHLESVPTAVISLDSKFFTGRVEACVLPNPVSDVILGNIVGLRDCENSSQQAVAMPAITRAQASKDQADLSTNSLVDKQKLFPEFRTVNLTIEQRSDSTLKPWFSAVGNPPVRGISFVVEDGILFRIFQSSTKYTKTLVVPQSRRSQVLSMAHDSPLSGHTGFRKTLAHVKSEFSWPGLTSDVYQFVRSCHTCQIKAPVGRDRPAPLQSMPPILEPFQRVVIDLVGPLPCTDSKNMYVLTLIDMATRWAEAVPLRSISSQHVAESLFLIFTRLGFPVEIQSDRGTQFISELFAEFAKLAGFKHLFSTPYHPQTNGVVERLHSTLKAMLRKLSAHNPAEWDKYLGAVLFAYRQQPHSSTGFSPFFLLFGRAPRGPMTMLRDFMLNNDPSCVKSLTFYYVQDLHKRMKEACEIAQQNIGNVASAARDRTNPKSRLKVFAPGDDVLVLLPDHANKLALSLKGPFKIVKRITRVVYSVDINGKMNPFHVNLLRKYYVRDGRFEVVASQTAVISQQSASMMQSGDGGLTYPPSGPDSDYAPAHVDSVVEIVDVCSAGVISEEQGTELGCEMTTVPDAQLHSQVLINPDLQPHQREDVHRVLVDFADVLTSRPGHTKTVEHVIRLKSDKVIRMKPYPLPFASQTFVEAEVRNLLDLGVIEPSTSPYCSPIVLVKKKDGSLRLCIDFRKLNAQTVLDATNIPLPEELFTQLSHSSIFTSCDLSKAYWQIPVHKDSRPYTAFQTPLGLMQWTRMPFGLVTAPATFCQLMRLVLADMKNVVCYFDDTLLHTSSWEQHIEGLRCLLSTLRRHGLTVNPGKLVIAKSSIEFLGHEVSAGSICPLSKKVDKILDLQPPVTKKSLRSLLGLISYYRSFIPDFASLTKPMTDLLRKGAPEKVTWNEECQLSFDKIKNELSTQPILIIPDVQDDFIVRTDASDYGIGAALMQMRDGVLRPCKYASRKLKPCETRYSTIERECLAIIFAVGQFYKYLAMRPFVLETDHRPLLFLKSGQAKNSRLLRWCLALQEFSFTIRAIPGSHNYHADVLSRLC